MKKRSLSLLRCVVLLIAFMLIIFSTEPSATAECGSCKNGGWWGFSNADCFEVSCTYEGYTSTNHTKRSYQRFFCPDCGDMLPGKPMEGVYSEAHNFDVNGRCVCGYSKPTNGSGSPSHSPEATLPPKEDSQVNPNTCKHTNKKSEKIGTSMAAQHDETYHKLIATYKDICADCGTVLTESRKETTLGLHRFETDGSCYCGYVRKPDVCSHTPIETLKNTRYRAGDVNGHEVIKTYHYECECKQVSYDDEKTSVGAHDYNRNTCRLCGFEKECEHPDFENVVSTTVEKIRIALLCILS